MADTYSIDYGVIKETVSGTTPATPVFLALPVLAGEGLNLTTEELTSEMKGPGANSFGMTKIAESASGTISMEAYRAPVVELLMESALGASFNANVLKASDGKTSMTIEKRIKEGSTTHYRRFRGAEAASMTLEVTANGNSSLAFAMVGLGADPLNTMVTGATYPAPVANKFFSGLDVSNVTVNGVNVVYDSLTLEVSIEKTARHGFGSRQAIKVGTAGMRTVRLTMRGFRDNYLVDNTLSSDARVNVEFTLGGANGYRFQLPAASATTPQDVEDGSDLFMEFTMVGAIDLTAGTSLVVTKTTA